jgi:hypothetical protein
MTGFDGRHDSLDEMEEILRSLLDPSRGEPRDVRLAMAGGVCGLEWLAAVKPGRGDRDAVPRLEG